MRCLLVFSIIALLLSCSSGKAEHQSTIEANKLTDSHEEIVGDISIKYAKNFKIKSSKNGYILDLVDPNSNIIERSYELTYDRTKSGEFVIHLPLQNVTAFSQTTVGMMSDLDVLDRLSGILDIDYVYDPAVIQMNKHGKLTEFLDESNFPVEKAIKSKTELIIYSGFSRDFPAAAKLDKFGIAAIPCYDWREIHPLGRAEWIKFVGVLCSETQKSIDLFNTIETRYREMCEKVVELDVYPSVVSGNFRGDQWTAPAGESYMAFLFSDAGANYVFKDSKGSGSLFTSMERIIKRTEDVDYWINPGFSTKEQILNANPKGKHVGPMKLNGVKGVYCYSHDMNKFWERSAIEPDKLLSDLIHIFHPYLEDNSELNFYKRLGN